MLDLEFLKTIMSAVGKISTRPKYLQGQNVPQTAGQKNPGAKMSQGWNVHKAEMSMGPKCPGAEMSMGPKCPDRNVSGRNVRGQNENQPEKQAKVGLFCKGL